MTPAERVLRELECLEILYQGAMPSLHRAQVATCSRCGSDAQAQIVADALRAGVDLVERVLKLSQVVERCPRCGQRGDCACPATARRAT